MHQGTKEDGEIKFQSMKKNDQNVQEKNADAKY